MSGKWFVFILAAGCLTLCGLVSARSAVADMLLRQGQLNAVLWLMPDHAGARVARAAPGDLALASAVAPTESAAEIDLGLEAESRGDLTAARAHLEEAARRDASFPPRWALINFLIRHGDGRDVLSRAAPAAATFEGDLSGLFDLCLRTGETPDRIYRTVVPPRPKAQREYLELLIRRGKPIDALPAALRLADVARPADRDLLFNYCDQLLDAGAGPKAALLWKGLPRFGPAGGHCLDWKQSQVDGITVVEATETAARLELNGRQPESALVLRRPVVVEPGRRYHLRALAVGENNVKAALEWRWNGAVVGPGDRTDLEMDATMQISELQLVIRRKPGDRAAEGSLEITNIRVEPKATALAGGRRKVIKPAV